MSWFRKLVLLVTIVLEVIYIPVFFYSNRLESRNELLDCTLGIFWWAVIMLGISSIVICILDIRSKKNINKVGWYVYILLVSWLSVPHYFFAHVIKE